VALLFEDPELELLAPDLILSEVANALRKAWRAEHLSFEDMSVAIDNLSRVAVSTVGVRALLPTIGPMLPHLSAYDACYLALAISRAAPIATFDIQLAGMAEARGISLILRST
jgi:predicted nucleic acid-binding protein